MRRIPVDTNRVAFIGTGKTAEVAEYVVLSDGSRRRSGNQAKNEDGVPVYVVDVMVMDPDAERAEIVGVKVASWEPPHTEMGKPVKFIGLMALGYVQQGTGRVAYSFTADGIEGAQPAAKAA